MVLGLDARYILNFGIMASKIVDLTARDVRYPTSLGLDGSDASHPDPDYSMVYIQVSLYIV